MAVLAGLAAASLQGSLAGWAALVPPGGAVAGSRPRSVVTAHRRRPRALWRGDAGCPAELAACAGPRTGRTRRSLRRKLRSGTVWSAGAVLACRSQVLPADGSRWRRRGCPVPGNGRLAGGVVARQFSVPAPGACAAVPVTCGQRSQKFGTSCPIKLCPVMVATCSGRRRRSCPPVGGIIAEIGDSRTYARAPPDARQLRV